MSDGDGPLGSGEKLLLLDLLLCVRTINTVQRNQPKRGGLICDQYVLDYRDRHLQEAISILTPDPSEPSEVEQRSTGLSEKGV
jgi:hypothetical protein